MTFCVCGATINKRDLPPDVVDLAQGATALWLDSDGGAYCYPDADNEADKWARHEPEDA